MNPVVPTLGLLFVSYFHSEHKDSEKKHKEKEKTKHKDGSSEKHKDKHKDRDKEKRKEEKVQNFPVEKEEVWGVFFILFTFESKSWKYLHWEVRSCDHFF